MVILTQDSKADPLTGKPPTRATTPATLTRFEAGEPHIQSDILAVEEPLEIQLGYGQMSDRRVKSVSVTMRTPGQDFDLVAGFLLTEGIVTDSAEIDRISYVQGRADVLEEPPEQTPVDLILPYQPEHNVVRVDLASDVVVSMANLERNFYTTSSCGICGKASLLALRTVCPPRAINDLAVSADLLTSLPERLRNAQQVFDKTGGLHAAGLFDSDGNLQAIREDVGRHNAVDKLFGSEFLADRMPLRGHLLFLSGRASFELLQKALMGGVSMVVSVGAPSSLAVQVAKEFDISLIGFLRGDRFNVYHGAERVLGTGFASGGVL
jgi:FdhD protein